MHLPKLPPPHPGILDELRARLRRGKLDLQTMRRIAAHQVPSEEIRRQIASCTRNLGESGEARIPSERSRHWERTSLPFLPLEILPPVVKRVPVTRPWQAEEWIPELSWVREIKQLTEEQQTFLRRCEHLIGSGETRKHEPLKRRSLQLTGDEKRLQLHMQSSLFQTGRLSAELLGFSPTPYLFHEQTRGDPETALILENKDSFVMATRASHNLINLPGYIIYGGGNAVTQGLEWLTETGIKQAYYVGDLDLTGMTIAQRCARRMQGKVEILPATSWHRRMMQRQQELGPQPREEEVSDELRAWLDPEVAHYISHSRACEESLSWEDHIELLID